MTSTPAVQDYLKAIWKLLSAGERATTSAVASELRVSAPSATAMLKRLAALGLAERRAYHGVVLTAQGERAALEVVRHHRLLESYLTEALGLEWHEVHEEADRLEHHLSEALEARIADALGHPTHDPHGDPIPTAALELDEQEVGSLADVADGAEAVVRRVPDEPGLLRYLAQVGLRPARAVRLVDRAPFDGPLTIEVGGVRHAISAELARRIKVSAA